MQITQQVEQYANLSDFISQNFSMHADKPAFSCFGQTLSYQEITTKAQALAAYLQANGLQAGDRIAIALPNIYQYPIAVYAALYAGLVIVNTNPMYTAKEMQHQFCDAGVKAVIALDLILPVVASILDKTKVQQIIVTQAADLITDTKHQYPTGCSCFNQALSEGASLPLNETTTTLDDIAVLQYTGGTTGVAKGAMLSHRNIISNTLQILELLGKDCITEHDIFVCPLPVYHIYAFTVNLILFASRGSTTILIPNPKDLDQLVASIAPFKVTGFSGLNTLFLALCHHDGFKTLDFSALRLTISGGAALTQTAANAWHQLTGCSITEGYGLSETSPVLTFNLPGKEVIGSVGKPLVETDIQLWDDNDKEVTQGQPGQIVAKGPQVMSGYWNRSDENSKVFSPDGYFKTGDIGVFDNDGNIKIVDRLKDMILVSGFNVYPNEIEEVLVSHPAINEAAVIGEPDERTGEKVVAYITIHEKVATDEVIAFCRSQLTAYKTPKKVVMVEQLPKSNVGKILRRELKNQSKPYLELHQ